MKDFHLALAAISLLVLAMGMAYQKIKRSLLSDTIFALGLGVFLGPPVLDLLELHDWGAFEKILQVASELTLSMSLMATAFRIPKDYLRGNKSLQTVLVFVGMLGMCAVSSVLVHLILGLDWRLSFLIGAIVTPTDPVVASTVVSGETAKRLIPARIRQAISFESGANDGLALPLVALAVVLLMEPHQFWTEWALKSVLWKTIGGAAFGFLIGYASGKLLVRARDAGWMSKSVLLSYSLSLGFFLLGFLEFVGSNGILGVFAGAARGQSDPGRGGGPGAGGDPGVRRAALHDPDLRAVRNGSALE